MTYRVRIWYREPIYELDAGARQDPFRRPYEVVADTGAEAEEQAVAEFHAMARLSSAGWIREIVPVDVEPRTGGARRRSRARAFA